MSKKILDKLNRNKNVVSDDQLDAALNETAETKVEIALDEHLEKIAAAHGSTHGSHHQSLIH